MKINIANSLKILNALIYSIRPSATIGTCILVLAAFDPGRKEVMESIIMTTGVFFGSAFCFLVNDIYDRKKDLLNGKRRPIATGLIPISVAINVSFVCAAILLAASWTLGVEAFLLAIAFLAITTLYSYINARSGLFANVIVALIVSGTQWGVAFLKPDSYLWISSFFLLFLTIPREVLLDWLDLPGDQKFGKPSFPMRHSLVSTQALIVLSLIFCSATVYWHYLNIQNTLTFILYVIAVGSTWISFMPFFLRPNNKGALQSIRLSHLSFAFLILALFSR